MKRVEQINFLFESYSFLCHLASEKSYYQKKRDLENEIGDMQWGKREAKIFELLNQMEGEMKKDLSKYAEDIKFYFLSKKDGPLSRFSTN